MSIAKDKFLLLNGFDEEFHVASGEDLELALRAQDQGVDLIFDGEITGIHNDWAGSTIRDFCKRQRLYTQTEPYFWLKYGDKTPRLEMVKSNLPPEVKKDGVKGYLWKKAKSALGTDTGQALIVGTCEAVEKVAPAARILWPLYRLALAGAIYRGFQEGLARAKVIRQAQ
jgi:hypothetical protein